MVCNGVITGHMFAATALLAPRPFILLLASHHRSTNQVQLISEQITTADNMADSTHRNDISPASDPRGLFLNQHRNLEDYHERGRKLNPPWKIDSERDVSSETRNLSQVAEQGLTRWKGLVGEALEYVQSSDHAKTPATREAFIRTMAERSNQMWRAMEEMQIAALLHGLPRQGQFSEEMAAHFSKWDRQKADNTSTPIPTDAAAMAGITSNPEIASSSDIDVDEQRLTDAIKHFVRWELWETHRKIAGSLWDHMLLVDQHDKGFPERATLNRKSALSGPRLTVIKYGPFSKIDDGIYGLGLSAKSMVPARFSIVSDHTSVPDSLWDYSRFLIGQKEM